MFVSERQLHVTKLVAGEPLVAPYPYWVTPKTTATPAFAHKRTNSFWKKLTGSTVRVRICVSAS